MSSGQAQIDIRQFHHANSHQPLDSEHHHHLYHDAAAAAAAAVGLHAHATSHALPHAHSPPPPNALMDPSHYNDFAFAYQGALADQSSLMALGDQSAIKYDAHPAAVFPQQSTMTSMPEHSHTINALPPHGAGFGGPGSDHRRSSMEGSDGVTHDRNSPMMNALEDSMADEFGLSGSTARADGTDLGGKAKDDRGDAAPAWSELKTKAGKERKRLPLACIACRRKKIRCSGEKPACKHCLRARTPCVYKVTTRKAAPRTDYMAMLDKRLKRMEERIIKVIPKAEQADAAATVTRAIVKPAIPGTLPAAKSGSKKRGADEAFGPELETWAKAPIKSNLASDDRPTSLQTQEAEENKLFQEGTDALPSKEIQEHLAEVFFDNIYGQAYHLLHKPSYMRKLKNGTLPPVLVLSVCAVAARFTNNPKLSSSTPQFLRGEEWASHARDICMRRYDWPNITILTCLLILGLHEFGTCQGGRSWALGGQAIRMAFALQLHKDLDHDPAGRSGSPQLSFIDREIRRRIMWASFLMDRFNSSGTERPMFIKEEMIQIPLPIKEQYFQLDMPAPTETLDGQVLHPATEDDGQLSESRANMGVAAYMIRSIAIWGRAITYLNQGGKEMDSHPMWSSESGYAKLLHDAENLPCTLPDSLQYSSENVEIHKTQNTASQFLFLHISIQQNILFLNRAAISASSTSVQPDAPEDFFAKASTKMFSAANRISELLKESEGSRFSVTAPFAGYCAFSSATVHILGIFSGDPASKNAAEANLTTNVKYLHQMKKYWGMFHWMIEHVRTQYRSALDAARSGVSNDSTASSPMLQYGDWFNRYPHGLSDAEFMDPAAHKKKEKGDDGVLEAKTELQSVEDYFSTLSPQSTGSRDGPRGSLANKRKNTGKKQGSAARPGQPSLDPLNTDITGQAVAVAEQLNNQQQNRRRFSNTLGGQTSGPTNFSPLTIPHSQNPSYSNLSPISPVNMTQFPHHGHHQAFFPPDLLAMNLNHQANPMIQPLDRQLVFGGYSTDSGNMAAGHNMMHGVEWDGISANPPTDRRLLGRRGTKGSINGQHQPAQTLGSNDGMAGFGGQEASSAWFMPFNMEPPEMSHDLGLSVGGLDAFAGMFSGHGNGGNSGMTTPNPLTGLRHGP